MFWSSARREVIAQQIVSFMYIKQRTHPKTSR